MEFSSHKGLDFLCGRRRYICKPVYNSICQGGALLSTVTAGGKLLCLSYNESKFEGKFIIIIELENEIWCGRSRGRLGVLRAELASAWVKLS
jgi:hypothetical protein